MCCAELVCVVQSSCVLCRARVYCAELVCVVQSSCVLVDRSNIFFYLSLLLYNFNTYNYL